MLKDMVKKYIDAKLLNDIKWMNELEEEFMALGIDKKTLNIMVKIVLEEKQ